MANIATAVPFTFAFQQQEHGKPALDSWQDVTAKQRTLLREYFHKFYITHLAADELPTKEKHVKNFMKMARKVTSVQYPEEGDDVTKEIEKIRKFTCKFH
jgi:hypothetical protein